MSKILKLAIGLLLVAVIGAVAWRFIHREVDDFADKKPTMSFTFRQLSELLLNDTKKLSSYKDELISVEGIIKKISKQDNQMVIEIGDDAAETSIVCQVDERHISKVEGVQENQNIKLKGIMTGFQVDKEMGLFNTVEMNYCSPDK